MYNYLNQQDWSKLHDQFQNASPFRHVVIDNFFEEDIAQQLLAEFPEYDSPVWDTYYNNPLENKKASNHWNRFPNMTYRIFHYLCSSNFEQIVQQISGHDCVYADVGLHGGGWHAHASSGKLNIHLDYSIHPKLNLERHYNLIVYLTPNWDPTWGGGLELWSNNDQTNQPKEMVQLVENRFNRAILFDTTQNSWHGLPKDLTCPDGTFRRSLAMYYVTNPVQDAPTRPRAKFAPYGEQANNKEILELIEKRQKL
jgi:Rps23 Pro-64 3,4-dihydroxylase Tpa1-like proline 4-hydroxylase